MVRGAEYHADMNTKRICLSVMVFACLGTPPTVTAGPEQAVNLGIYRHVDHSTFTELPFHDGDFSYGVAYEIHEGGAFWQLGVDMTPSFKGTNGAESVTDYAITPQLNLIFTDRLLMAGVGILSSYVKPKEGDADWMDPYWQFILGLDIPLGRITLDLYSCYVFKQWDKLNDFDAKDIEFGGRLGFKF